MILLYLSIVVSIVSILVVAFDLDRWLISKLYSAESYVGTNYKKPKGRNKVVLLFRCNEPLSQDTIKSLLDQSVRVDDISVECSKPENHKKTKHIVSIHKPGTLHIREGDMNTTVIEVTNGTIYPYDYVELHLRYHRR